MGENICESKKSYPDEISAYLALETIRLKGKIMPSTPVRSYKCNFCNKYHLTSQKKKGK